METTSIQGVSEMSGMLPPGAPFKIDFNNSHNVINALTSQLQQNFKTDTHYKHALMTPHANIVYALDRDSADHMIGYMSAQMRQVAGFQEDEFHFTCRAANDGACLQRIRLEFTSGVTAIVLCRIISALEVLKHSHS